MNRIPHIVNASYLHDYVLKVTFDDGYSTEYDVRPALRGEMGTPLLDFSCFKQFRIEQGALVWPNGFDACPDYLRFHYAGQN